MAKGQTLGKPGIGSALNSRIVDQLDILEWVRLQAVDNNASAIFLTGDVFEDTKPHPTIIALFISWLKKCTDSNLTVHIVAGNHDILRSGQFTMSALDIISAADIENVYVYKNVDTVHTNGVSFTLIPFRDRRSFNTNSNSEALSILSSKMPYELASIDRNSARVVIGHLAIENSIPVGDELGDVGNELFCPVDMFKDYDYTWMGHIHSPQIMSKAPFVAHIGSMDLSDFGESNHTKHIVLFDPDSSYVFKQIDIPSRPLKQISISVPGNIIDTTAFVLDKLSKHTSLSKSIVSVNVSLEGSDMITVDRHSIENRLNDMGVFHIARLCEEKKVAIIKKNSMTESIDSTVNETTAIKMYADLNIDDDMRADFIASANDIVEQYKVKQ